MFALGPCGLRWGEGRGGGGGMGEEMWGGDGGRGWGPSAMSPEASTSKEPAKMSEPYTTHRV